MKLGKSSTLCVVSSEPGRCRECRHANQGTRDFAERRVVCEVLGRPTGWDAFCEARVHARKEPTAQAREYYYFEPYDGTNGTWQTLEDRRALAEDASEEQRRALRADRPLLRAGEEL